MFPHGYYGETHWAAPNGKTPEAALYASILRNIRKDKEAKYVKADRGTFKLIRRSAHTKF
jgi:hypothetical protein